MIVGVLKFFLDFGMGEAIFWVLPIGPPWSGRTYPE